MMIPSGKFEEVMLKWNDEEKRMNIYGEYVSYKYDETGSRIRTENFIPNCVLFTDSSWDGRGVTGFVKLCKVNIIYKGDARNLAVYEYEGKYPTWPETKEEFDEIFS